jgi:adenylate cyclase
MADEGFKRKLAAILSADAVGYSRLMADDETATVKTIASYREIMISLIKQHRGRVVDSPGDNLLAEFSSVVDAVQCAVAVQNEFQTRNAELAENRRMEFRIGINLGDVIDEEDRIYGDGVNVAARLEALADSGGICVSKTAFDQVETKLPLGYEYLGEQPIKNIPKPVGAYRVLMKPDAAGKVIGEKRFLGRYSRRTAMAAIIILLIVAGGLISWNIYLQQSRKVEPAVIEKMAFPLPDKPSIAVLPFVNISEDPAQDYISDGFTNTIITLLYKVPELFVIDRHSSSTYKGKKVKIQQVAEELGVRHVLEGSVQKSGNRIRVNVQLIDALSGNHLWADLYDREYKDIFSVQDEIIRKIVTELAVKISWGEAARSWAHSTDNVKALDYFYQSEKYLIQFQKESNIQMREVLKKAVHEDPKYARAIAFWGLTHLWDVLFGWAKDPSESLKKAESLAKQAQSIKENYASYALLGRIYLYKRNYEQAITAGERAVEVEPNNAMGHYYLATTMIYVGRPKEGLTIMMKAMRLCPHPPIYFLYRIGEANYLTGRYEEALFAYQKFLERQTKGALARNVWHWLISSYMELDREKSAKEELKKLMIQHPDCSIEAHIRFVKRAPYKDFSFLDRQIELLRKAGLN